LFTAICFFSYPDRGDFAPLIVKHGNASFCRRGRLLGNRGRNPLLVWSLLHRFRIRCLPD
jgi:hypothetical protein